MGIKLSHQEWLTKYENAIHPTVEVLGTYIASALRIDCRCKECGKAWSPFAQSVSLGIGCSACTGHGGAPITPETFAKRAKQKNTKVTLLDDFIDFETMLNTQCNSCARILPKSPRVILRGKGCKYCAATERNAKQKKDPKTFLAEVAKLFPEIEVLETYIHNKHKLKCRCTNCGHEWKALPTDFLSKKHGCPPCGLKRGWQGRRSKTVEEFYKQLPIAAPTIETVEECIGANDPLKVRCKTCSHEWESTAYRVLGGIGCIKCQAIKLSEKFRFTQDEFEALVQEANPLLKITGKYVNSGTKVSFDCLKCGTNNQETSGSTLRHGGGCRKCAFEVSSSYRRHTHDEFIQLTSVSNPDIRILGTYTLSTDAIACECKQCGYQWAPRAAEVLKGAGCSVCKKGSFNPTKPATFYLLEIIHNGTVYYGFGISGPITNRLRDHRCELTKKSAKIVNQFLFDFEIGFEAKELEYAIKEDERIPTSNVLDIGGFKTEAFLPEYLPLVMQHIESCRRKWVKGC